MCYRHTMTYDEGMSLFKTANYRAAAEQFADVTEADENNHKAWNALGICLSKTGQYDQADVCFENAVTLDPSNVTYKKNRDNNKIKVTNKKFNPKISKTTVPITDKKTPYNKPNSNFSKKNNSFSIFNIIRNILGFSEIQEENIQLKSFIQEIGASDALIVKKNIENLKFEENEAINRKKKLIQDIKGLEEKFLLSQSEILSLDEQLMLESFSLYKPHFAFSNSEEYKQKLDLIREYQKQMIKSGNAADASYEWTVKGSKSEGRKMVNDTIKLLLRSFNNECDYCVDHVKFNNIELFEKRITKSYEALNKLGRIMNIKISSEYKNSKISELYLSHEYQIKKQQEKEEQRRLKEEEREAQKSEKEIREIRNKIDKERKHFLKAISDLNHRLTSSIDPLEIANLKSKLEEFQSGLIDLDKEEKEVDYREKNAKAGYVYVISNIGAFGDDVFKIGMTRRLDPQERIDELSDTSVPFRFDVHALIFSDNAPDLEAKIQNHFHKSRLNKINPRREFFRANIEEIEEVIKNNFEKTLDFIKEVPAEEYRESMKISE